LSAVTRSLNEKKIFKKIQSKTKKQAVTTFLVICLISSINMFPQIGLSLVFDLIGQFMCNPLAYAFPFLFLAIKCHKNKDYGIKFFGSLIFIIGSVSFAFGGFIYPRLQQDLTLNDSLNMNTTAVSNVTLN
jgi:cytochrome bd-type quinol oxidase subunit 2